MKATCCLLTFWAALSFLPAPLIAQSGASAPEIGAPSSGFGAINPYNLVQKHWIVAGKVTTLQGDPVRGAKVEIEAVNASAEYRTIETDFQGQFRTEYWLNADLTKDLRVSLVANKKGFLKAHEMVHFISADKPWLIPITLREPREDPALLSQEDLIFTLGPRLNGLGEADGLSAKSEKDYARGVADFLDRNRPDRAVASFGEVLDRDPGCLGCRTMMALAELASSDWDSAARDDGEAVAATLKDRAHGRAEPLVLYGVMQGWRRDDQATAYFLEALKFAPHDPLALQELGRTQMLAQNWAAADSYLAQAVAAGAGPESRLMRVEALLGQENSQEANAEMARYLNGRDVEKMPVRVRQLWLQIRDRKRVEAVYLKPTSTIEGRIDYLKELPPDLSGLEPAKSQEPLESILTAVGKNVADLFRNFPNTSSVELIHEQKLLRKNNRVAGSLDQKFHYLCLTPVETYGPGFQEYRVGLGDNSGQPWAVQDGFMLTSGFASAALIFHPAYQGQASFHYVGRQKVNGRDALVIAFAQRPDKARVNGAFKLGGTSVPTFSQGLAWVDPGKYQILRLRTDLLKPLPDVRLERQTTEIVFGETHFKGMEAGFWLPREVSVAVDWNGRRLRNQHEYSDFKLFNVGSVEKRGKLKNRAAAGTEASK